MPCWQCVCAVIEELSRLEDIWWGAGGGGGGGGRGGVVSSIQF